MFEAEWRKKLKSECEDKSDLQTKREFKVHLHKYNNLLMSH